MATIYCVDCREQFDPANSLMGSEGQCQDCWEEQCNASWWRLMKRLDEADGRRWSGWAAIPDGVNEGIAAFLEAAGRKPKISTGIHDRITRGYGRLDEFGLWQFPLPDGEEVRP